MTAPEKLLILLREKEAALGGIDLKRDTAQVIDSNMQELYDLQRDQLFQGKGADGNNLMRITDDPVFLLPKHQRPFGMTALEYVAWKYRITPQTPYNQPNLFINGTTHNALHIKRDGSTVNYMVRVPWADSVAAKYRNNELGLNEDSKGWFKRFTLRPALVKRYATLLGCKVV